MPKLHVRRHEVIQPLDQSYRLIPLTQGQNAIVDAADFEWLSQWNWYAHWSPGTKTFYAVRNKSPNMHQLILGCGTDDDIDHKNNDTLDNRRNNLRKCTHGQNAANTKRRTKWGYKGVVFYPTARKHKWSARIVKDGKHIHLGMFLTVEEAAKAYDAAAKIYHGEFAQTNFPEHY
jgi:hypothetical protein